MGASSSDPPHSADISARIRARIGERSRRTARWVLQRCTEGAAVVCIEPLKKADLALTFSGWLEGPGAEDGQRCRVERVACERLLPRVGENRAELPRCTSLLARW